MSNAEKNEKGEEGNSLKSKSLVIVLFVSLLATMAIPMGYAEQRGPDTDVLRGTVIKSPDAQLLAMQTELADVSVDQIRTSDIDKLVGDGFTMTDDPGFHMGYMAYNIRSDQSYRRDDLPHDFWPLADVNFRHALVHGYDQLSIMPSIYGYTVTPVRSLVPPSQSYWYNPDAPEHPFNLGDPYDPDILTNNPHSSVGILLQAGYTFVPGAAGTADDYWKDPNGDALPKMLIWTPLESVAPTSWSHGQEFVKDLATIGLRATSANGQHGMDAEGADFNWYLEQVFDYSNFDGYMVFWGLGRVPDQAFVLCHSDFDTIIVPGAYNAPGINDPTVDDLLEIMMFTLPPPPGQFDARRKACFDFQDWIYTVNASTTNSALAYMLMYSRTYFNAFDQDLTGIIKSPGYGSDNSWTWLNIHWLPGKEQYDPGTTTTVIEYIVGEDPDSFNPCYASTVYEWFYIGATMDGLMAVNPYNHADMPWLATDWELVETGNPAAPMDITYTLNETVEWQDGWEYNASCAEFNLNFIKDWQVPRYAGMWKYLDSVTVHNATCFTVSATETNWVLLYDFAGDAALLPPQIWDRTWANQQEVLDYDPTEAYNVAPGYTAGDNPTPTNLFGTGPWIFQFYDATNAYGDLYANRAGTYFKSTEEVVNQLKEMFHGVGDVDRDGDIDIFDQYAISSIYGYFWYEPQYNPNADINSDKVIDIRDIVWTGAYLGWKGEYP